MKLDKSTGTHKNITYCRSDCTNTDCRRQSKDRPEYHYIMDFAKNCKDYKK